MPLVADTRTPLVKILSEGLGLLVPPICLGCGAEPRRTIDALCSECEVGLIRPTAGACARCAQELPCSPCPAVDSGWELGWAGLVYDGTARQLVRAVKQSGARRAVRVLAAAIVESAPACVWESSAVMAVPAHPSRRRASGVDHAGLIAAEVARLACRPLGRGLVRTGAAARQAGSTLALRTEPGRVSFELVRPVAPKVVLVDDVWTSGTTLAAATNALARGGCTCVAVAAATRANSQVQSLPQAADW